MEVIDQLRAPGADVPALLAANKDALITGLEDLESADPATMAWRDALVTALTNGDMEGGMWWAGQAQGLVEDIPRVEELVTRTVSEATRLVLDELAEQAER